MPRVPRAAWALGLTAMAVGLGATGCKSKAEEPAAQENFPEQRIVEEELPEPEPLRETGVLERDWDVYAGEMDDRNRYVATVMIAKGDPLDSVECSGVLLSPRLVLTAGSCVCSPHPVQMPSAIETTLIDGSACAKRVGVATAIYGEVLDQQYKETATQMKFRLYQGEVHPHPDLELRLDARGAVVSSRADLAAIVLDTPVVDGPSGIPLADSEVQSDEALVMAGHVRNTPQAIGGFMRVRYYRPIQVQSVSSEGRIRYEQQGALLYNGYMGGPCIREKGAARSLVGIASVDSDEQPSFTSTYVFRDWLAAEMRRAAGRSGTSTGNSKKKE